MVNKKEETEYTTIRITVKLWKYLNECRVDPKMSAEEIIWNFVKFNNPDLKKPKWYGRTY